MSSPFLPAKENVFLSHLLHKLLGHKEQKGDQGQSHWGLLCDLALVIPFLTLHCLIFVVMEEGPLLESLTCAQ